MPEVPPHERDPESERPEQGAPPPSMPESPPEAPFLSDAVFTPPRRPFGRPRDEEADRMPEADTPPSDRPYQDDVGLTSPPGPFDRPGEEPTGGEPSIHATPSEVVAPTDDEVRTGENPPGAAPPEHAEQTARPTDGSQAPTAMAHPADAFPATTTGVPHYLPPSAPPALPAGPGVAVEPLQPESGAAAPAAEPSQPRSILRPIGRGLREVAETIILALLIFLLVRAVVQNFQVEGGSMQPTLETKWYLLVNKAIYWEINLETVSKFVPFVDPGDDPTRFLFRGPHRGDIIVFKAPTQTRGQPERDFIKRVIAVPGETVEVRDCTVFIDGEPLDEPYAIYANSRQTTPYGPETVPPDHYFVLGDNRNNSSDSRSWGMLPKDNIIGQAWLTYWPFSAFGLVNNTSVKPGDGATEALTGASATGKPAPACP